MQTEFKLVKPPEGYSHHLVIPDPAFEWEDQLKDEREMVLECKTGFSGLVEAPIRAGFSGLTKTTPTERMMRWHHFLNSFVNGIYKRDIKTILRSLEIWDTFPLPKLFSQFIHLSGEFNGTKFCLVPVKPYESYGWDKEGSCYYINAVGCQVKDLNTTPYEQLLILFSDSGAMDTKKTPGLGDPFGEILSGKIDETIFARALKALDPVINNFKQGKRHRGKAYPAYVDVLEIAPENAISGANKQELAATIAKEIGNGFEWTHYSLVRKAKDIWGNSTQKGIKILITVPKTRRWYLLRKNLPICAERLPRGNPKTKSPKNK